MPIILAVYTADSGPRNLLVSAAGDTWFLGQVFPDLFQVSQEPPSNSYCKAQVLNLSTLGLVL